MRVPKRKSGKYSSSIPTDTFMTPEKLTQLEAQLDRLKQVSRPRAALEAKRLAEMGDLSDNAAYSIAKGRLRGINQRIEDLERQIHNASVIDAPTQTDRVAIGNHVTVEINGAQQTYHLLGSSETRPEAGVISHVSPLGAALKGRKVGETVEVHLAADKTLTVTIKDIK